MNTEALLLVVIHSVITAFGVVVNALILGVIANTACAYECLPPSDAILVNLAFVNLLISLVRNGPLLFWDAGVRMSLSDVGCKLCMGVWVVTRSVSVWTTLTLSMFHYLMVSRRHTSVKGKTSALRNAALTLLCVWAANVLFSLPAVVFSGNSAGNFTERLMLVSGTVRPLLGCVLHFASAREGLAYTTASMIINEIVPIVLMVTVNIKTLLILHRHRRQLHVASLMPSRVSTEVKAAKVIMVVVTIFVICWGIHVFAINYYNYRQDDDLEWLISLARFSTAINISMGPLILVVGHGKLRSRIKQFLLSICK
uniref:Olfactory receptor class A-like protein 4 n=1 Tax=Petromyzon marinus TaxID=7757 RepID=A0AAJ7THQ5_PETMA|nr:olfactory receptor class A-like protein 4 [Petromyzon marinus]